MTGFSGSRRRAGQAWVLLVAVGLAACGEAPRPPIDPELEAALFGVDAPDGAGGVDGDAIAADVRFLADDALEGRAAGTEGYDRAAQYVVERFAESGLKPASDAGGYLQRVPLLRADLVVHDTSVNLRRGKAERALENGVDILVSPDFARERGALTAPLAFVGYGVTAPHAGYDDYADMNVRGKVVIQFRGAPASLANNQRAYYASPWVKRQAAVDRGAVGILTLLTPKNLRQMPWERLVARAGAGSMRWLESGGTPRDAFVELFVQGLLSESGARILFEGAATSFDQAVEVAEASRPQAFDLAGEIRVATATRHSPASSANVLARLPGSDPAVAGEHIVLTAHLDHLGVGTPVDGDAIYNGAYDNASGVAVLLEVARVLAGMPQPPRRSILFAAVTGEERGLLGSDYLAQHAADTVGTVVANLNLDMVMMLNPLEEVIGFGAEHSTLGDAARLATAQLGLVLAPDPFPGQVVFIRSDQYSFVRRGVPALMLATGPGPDFGRFMAEIYHSPADDLSQPMDFQAAADFARLNVLVTSHIADAARRPAWNSGDFFGDKFAAAE